MEFKERPNERALQLEALKDNRKEFVQAKMAVHDRRKLVKKEGKR